jgi:hypothetical protein
MPLPHRAVACIHTRCCKMLIVRRPLAMMHLASSSNRGRESRVWQLPLIKLCFDLHGALAELEHRAAAGHFPVAPRSAHPPHSVTLLYSRNSITQHTQTLVKGGPADVTSAAAAAAAATASMQTSQGIGGQKEEECSGECSDE